MTAAEHITYMKYDSNQLSDFLNSAEIPDWYNNLEKEEVLELIDFAQTLPDGDKGRFMAKLQPAIDDAHNYMCDDYGDENPHNAAWNAHHRQILQTMKDYTYQNSRPPSKAELARLTGLARSTIHNHFKECSYHPQYAQYLKDFSMLSSEIMGKAFTLAMKKDSIPAMRLYLQMAPKMQEYVTKPPACSTGDDMAELIENESHKVPEMAPIHELTKDQQFIRNTIRSRYQQERVEHLLSFGRNLTQDDVRNFTRDEFAGIFVMWLKTLLEKKPKERVPFIRIIWDVLNEELRRQIEGAMEHLEKKDEENPPPPEPEHKPVLFPGDPASRFYPGPDEEDSPSETQNPNPHPETILPSNKKEQESVAPNSKSHLSNLNSQILLPPNKEGRGGVFPNPIPNPQSRKQRLAFAREQKKLAKKNKPNI